MSLYELDDELVQEFVDGNWIPGPGGLLAEALTVILVKQRAERRTPRAPGMTPADELAAAADKLDALAAGATEGPWTSSARASVPYYVEAPGWTIASNFTQGDADYIAAMNPLVGKALAAWLRLEAEALTRAPMQAAYVTTPDDIILRPALAIARLINGTAS